MDKFNSAIDVPRRCLGSTVIIGDEEVYIDAEFMIGKLLSGHILPEDRPFYIKMAIIIPLTIALCLIGVNYICK